MSLPSTITIETILVKDMVLMCLTSLLNTPIESTLSILKNIDQRRLNGETTEKDCSFQVQSAYKKYLEYLPLIDKEYYEKTKEYR